MLIRRLLIQTITRQQSQVSSVRLYGRWLHRNPAKVLLPFEPTSKLNLKKEKVINLDPKIVNKSEGQSQHATKIRNDENRDCQEPLPPAKSKEVRSKKEEKAKKRKFYLSQQKVFDDNSEIIYEKFKENDSRVR